MKGTNWHYDEVSDDGNNKKEIKLRNAHKHAHTQRKKELRFLGDRQKIINNRNIKKIINLKHLAN